MHRISYQRGVSFTTPSYEDHQVVSLEVTPGDERPIRLIIGRAQQAACGVFTLDHVEELAKEILALVKLLRDTQ